MSFLKKANKISIAPTWSFYDDQGRILDPQLFILLRHIDAEKKLTAAAKKTGISYRHAWNQLNKWADFFGVPLVELEKGRGAQLTLLGEKLLWAERRVIARLEPQLDNITSELNIELKRVLEGVKPKLVLHASHGFAVELLPGIAQHFEMDLQYKHGEDALNALDRNECDIAGFHLPDRVLNPVLKAQIERVLKPKQHRLIRFITRQQGLILPAGNPRQITGLHDLTRPEIRFINREPRSGTRLLLEELLFNAGIDFDAVLGKCAIEYTHSAVAAHIAAGMADCGFGVQAAAAHFGLEFIPLEQEQYLFACPVKTLAQPAMSLFMEALSSSEFRATIDGLPGYNGAQSGEFMSIEELLQR